LPFRPQLSTAISGQATAQQIVPSSVLLGRHWPLKHSAFDAQASPSGRSGALPPPPVSPEPVLEPVALVEPSSSS
jgi:hypothetical protein